MQRYTLRTTAHPAESRRLAKAAVCILGQSLCNQDLVYELDLLLTEACSNVVRHAYRNREPGELTIRLRVNPPDWVEAEICDRGKGYDPSVLSYENPNPSAESGRGMFIMATLSDRLEHRREGDRNILSFRKNVGQAAWKTCE